MKNNSSVTKGVPSNRAAIPESSPTSLRIVIKVGTSSLVHQETGIRLGQVASIMETVAALRKQNHCVILVTSGAVGTGAHELGILERPSTISQKQALAAVGQVRLMRELNSMLSTLGVDSAQVLLTQTNLRDPHLVMNARATMEELFRLGVVPVVNDNDAVSIDESSDNDNLSAMVSCLVEANILFLLTDVNGLYDSSPNLNPDAKRIDVVKDFNSLSEKVNTDTGPGTQFSRGGMESKIIAAEIATKNGIKTVIMSTSDVSKLPQVLEENRLFGLGTLCLPVKNPHTHGRKRWIQSLPVRGKIIVDSSSENAMKSNKSLFAPGVVEIQGTFKPLDAIEVYSQNDELLATGLTNFSQANLEKFIGKNTDKVRQVVGDGLDYLVVIDEENLNPAVDFSNEL